jgi:hypothetical protein
MKGMIENVRFRLVGTRGGCGDGWGPCACPRRNVIPLGFREVKWFTPNKDKHKAPASAPPRLLSLLTIPNHHRE